MARAIAYVTYWSLDAATGEIVANLNVAVDELVANGAVIEATAKMNFTLSNILILAAIRAATKAAILAAGGPVIADADLKVLGAQ